MRLREYIAQKTDDGKSIRTVPIGNSLAPWRVWLEEGDIRYAKHVDRQLTRFELFNIRLRDELRASGEKMLPKGLVRSWRRF